MGHSTGAEGQLDRIKPAAYIKSWLDSLKESPQFIKTTLLDVKKASLMLTQHIDKIAAEIEEGKVQDKGFGDEKIPERLADGMAVSGPDFGRTDSDRLRVSQTATDEGESNQITKRIRRGY